MKNRILLISLAVILALSVGLICCTTEYRPEITECTLTISSTEGGSITTPGEGTFTYAEGEVVDLVAVADKGYQFVRWTGYGTAAANADAASTTIAMNGNYSITARFAKGIRDWYDLDAIRNNLDDNYVLMNDLDSTSAGYTQLASPTANDGSGWEPIGTAVEGFSGSLDGQQYEIENLFINRPSNDWVGLFGFLGDGCVVANIGITGASVVGKSSVGTLTGVNALMGSVDNCYSTGGVTGITDIGGLVGYNNGRVSNSYSGCNVSGNWNVGGLVGTEWTHGLVTSCYSAGSVIGHTAVGGLLGQSYVSTVMYCYCTGNVMGDLFTGGLVGQTTRSVGQTARSGVVGTPINSFWDMQTSETEASDGGTGKTTAEMKSIVTFSRAGWNIVAVANPSTRNPAYIWNIVDGQTYPFLSWQS